MAREGLLGRNGVGMLLATSGAVWNANRSAFSLRVRVLGKSAHVGLQHQGANAFERMHRVVERLEQLKHEVEQRSTQCSVGAQQMRNSILMLGGQRGGGANFNGVLVLNALKHLRMIYGGNGERSYAFNPSLRQDLQTV